MLDPSDPLKPIKIADEVIKSGKEGSIKKIKEYLRSVFFDLFIEKRDINEQFQEILGDLHKNKHPVIIADKIGSAIQQKFRELHNKMSLPDYYRLCTSVIESLNVQLSNAIGVWKDKVVNFKDVKEVWVACEPMLELSNEIDGAYSLLTQQLECVDKVTYFVSDKRYFEDLKWILSNNGQERHLSKIEYVKIDKPYDIPVVIYHSKNSHGMIGKYHPNLKKGENGFYYFNKKLCVDWMQSLDDTQLFDTHFNTLRSYKSQP